MPAPQPIALTSQIMARAPHFHGPLARVAGIAPGAEIEATMHGRANDNPGQLADSPLVSWRMQGSEHGGPLSLFSFLFLHAMRPGTIGGMRVSCRIERADLVAGAPFIVRHPSGFYQVLHYNQHDDLFLRQVLYPIDEIATPQPQVQSVPNPTEP